MSVCGQDCDKWNRKLICKQKKKKMVSEKGYHKEQGQCNEGNIYYE